MESADWILHVALLLTRVELERFANYCTIKGHLEDSVYQTNYLVTSKVYL